MLICLCSTSPDSNTDAPSRRMQLLPLHATPLGKRTAVDKTAEFPHFYAVDVLLNEFSFNFFHWHIYLFLRGTFFLNLTYCRATCDAVYVCHLSLLFTLFFRINRSSSNLANALILSGTEISQVNYCSCFLWLAARSNLLFKLSLDV